MRGWPEFQSPAARDSPGTTLFSISRRFALTSAVNCAPPVRFPPGCARLAIKPVFSGSIAFGCTMGMVLVAFITARAAGVVTTMIMSTLSRTISAANSLKRSAWPRAYRRSTMRLWPSSYPYSRRPSNRRHKNFNVHGR